MGGTFASCVGGSRRAWERGYANTSIIIKATRKPQPEKATNTFMDCHPYIFFQPGLMVLVIWGYNMLDYRWDAIVQVHVGVDCGIGCGASESTVHFVAKD